MDTVKGTPDRTMFVRYIGNKVCWTVDDGRFYMGEIAELTEEERKLCDNGGGDMPLSMTIHVVAS